MPVSENEIGRNLASSQHRHKMDYSGLLKYPITNLELTLIFRIIISLLNKLIALENKYAKFMSTFGEYPAIVITKKK